MEPYLDCPTNQVFAIFSKENSEKIFENIEKSHNCVFKWLICAKIVRMFEKKRYLYTIRTKKEEDEKVYSVVAGRLCGFNRRGARFDREVR